MGQFPKKWQSLKILLQHPFSEYGLFGVFITLSLYYIWSVPAFVSMDGPAHLYNASLINQYDSSELLQEFYQLNSVLLPNSLTHRILALLLCCAPPLACEKILVSILAIALPLTFRLAVRALSEQRTAVSSLIFLLVFSNLLHNGFYNFCFAFIFFNIQIWLFVLMLNNNRRKLMLALLFIVNSLLLLFTHGFVFVAAVCVIILLILARGPLSFRTTGKTLGEILLLLVPALIFFFYFFFQVKVPDYDYDLDSYQKWKNLTGFSSAMVFDEKNELGYSTPVFILLLVMTVAVLAQRIDRDVIFKPLASDLFFVLFLGLLYLIFHSTDGLFGGMFIQRLFYFGFYSWIFWLCCMRINAWLTLASIIVMFYAFMQLGNERKKVMLAAAPEINAVLEAGTKIADESVVQVFDLSHSWFRGHFSNYLGVNKALVLTDNYEAVLDWFPMKWKKDIHQVNILGSGELHEVPDYVFIYTNPRLPQLPDSSVSGFLAKNARLIYLSEQKSCALYEVRKP